MSERFSGTVSISPTNSRVITASIDGNTGNMVLGGTNRDGDIVLRDGRRRTRVRLDGNGQRLELLNTSGKIIGMIGGGGNVRAGSNGENGDLFLYRATATNIFSHGQWSVRLSANDGRLETRNAQGELNCMVGANGNLRLGSNGADGDILLYPRTADNIFNNGQATVTVDATTGDINLGNNGVNGDVFLRDASGTVRARLRSASQRLELLNGSGEIISMIGGGGNIRAGSNGENGDLFLYPSSAGNIFNDGAANVALRAESGNLTLGGGSGDGDVVLRDTNKARRVHLSAGDQRVEIRNPDGKIIAMMGGSANVRVGTNGLAGNMYLYPREANDIFNNGQATIELNGQSGDIVLRNADCAEEFPLLPGIETTSGQVVCLAEDARVRPTDRAYDKRVVGIVAGAVTLKPGIVLGRGCSEDETTQVALMGRVYCLADASNGAIEIGDLMVSSSLEGHAMKAADPSRAFGAVIGKAIDPLEEGTGLIRVLVSLR